MIEGMETFDRDNISEFRARKFSKNLKKYIILRKEVMIIPDEIIKSKSHKAYKEGIKKTKKLVKKLEKAKKSVFRKENIWNYFE
jgi:uncharacterized membrane-anchored protein YjiN (DUF445 family)